MTNRVTVQSILDYEAIDEGEREREEMRKMSARQRWASLSVGVAVAVVVVVSVGVGLSAASSSAPRDTLVVLDEDVAPGLDTEGSNLGGQAAQQVMNNLLEPLLTYPSKPVGDILVPNYKVGPFGYEPRLATSWTKKGLVWTFHLRRGVKSCAGNTFTADDVIYTFQRAMAFTGGSPFDWFLGYVSGILPLAPSQPNAKPSDKKLRNEVVKIDTYTVQFRQRTPNELFPRVLQIFALAPLDSTEMKKHATVADPWSHRWADTNAAPSTGYGPYCLSKWIKGSEIDLVANPHYYRGQPQFKKIVIRKVPATANRTAAILSGSADVASNLSPQQYDAVAKSKNAKVISWDNNVVLFLGMSYKFAPWNSPNTRLLRQAIAYALPYRQIITQAYGGKASRWNGLCESNYYGFNPSPGYGTNIPKAKQLLAQAGFPNGKGLPSSGLVIYYPAEHGAWLEPVANAIRTALKQIGVQVALAPISNAVYTDRRLTKYDMPMFMDDGDRPLAPDVGYCSLLWYVSKKNGGLTTDSSYNNPAFDALYAQSAKQTGKARLVTLKKMQRILMTDLPKIPIVEVASRFAMHKDLTRWQGTTYDIGEFWSLKTK